MHHGVYVVFKVARGGASVSLTKKALEMGLKVLVVVPTKKIARELNMKIPTLVKKPLRIMIVGPNVELCIKLDASLNMLFQLKEKCHSCKYRNDTSKCPFQNLLKNNFDLLSLSYKKLETLFLSKTKTADVILQKLTQFDVVILDEFSTAILADIQTIEIVGTDAKGRTVKLSDEIRKQVGNPELWSLLLLKFLSNFESDKVTGVYTNTAWKEVFLDDSRKDEIFKRGWREITSLTKKGLDTLNLQMAFLAAFAEKVVATVEDGKVSLTPSVDDALAYLKEFVALLGSEKRIFVVDSYQPSIHFESLFGKIVPVVWGKDGDPLATNSQQLVVSDTAHWGVRDFFRGQKMQDKLQRNVERLISKFSAKNVIIVTTNKRMAKAVFKWGLPEEVKVTWFRSELSRGVPVEGRRVMIILAGPFLPKTAYVPQSMSFRLEDFVTEMDALQSDVEKAAQLPRLLKLDDMRGEFLNCIGRVKDATAKEKSIVICFGIREAEVKALLKDNSPFKLSKPKIVRTVYGGSMINEGIVIAELWMKHSTVTDPQDLKVLARIIVLVKQRKSVPASQVVFGKTEIVKAIALKHQQVLDKFGVTVSFKTGGATFEAKQ